MCRALAMAWGKQCWNSKYPFVSHANCWGSCWSNCIQSDTLVHLLTSDGDIVLWISKVNFHAICVFICAEESDGVTTKNVSKRDFYFVAVFWEWIFHHILTVFFQNIEKRDVDKIPEELEQQKDNTHAEVAFTSADHGNIAKLIPTLVKMYKNK